MAAPLSEPAVYGIETVLSLVRVTVPIVGADGTAGTGVIEFEAAEATE